MAHPALEQPKRGYLANIWTIPPLIYPFQYNPTQITDSKKIEWGPKYDDQHPGGPGGLPGLSGISLGSATEKLGRVFSTAEIRRLQKEDARTINFRFTIDGREQREGEPARRRNMAGDIVGDLAVIRSFAYPQLANWLDMASALTGSAASGLQQATTWSNLWFNHPPTLTLVFGDMSCEGFVTDMKITETLFNSDLNPTRADIEITIEEKIDSVSFILDAVKRLGRTVYYTDYEDILNVLF
jgi:hypothetical protein